MNHQLRTTLFGLVALGLSSLAGCAFQKATEGQLRGGDAGIVIEVPDMGPGGTFTSDASVGGLAPDVAFTPADHGGYANGGSLSGSGATGVVGSAEGCNTIMGVIRDFKGKAEAGGGHPDFEVFSGKAATPALVEAQLGPDQKPVYASKCEVGVATSAACPYGPQTTTKAAYDEWYRNTDGVNKPYLLYLQFESNGGVSTFSSSNFFPVDGVGWGDSGMTGDGKSHNFGFTTEVHTNFAYHGGEHFTFTGDDDLWVFINGKRALDLGGLHPQLSATVDLDASAAMLGIAKGMSYSMDLFHAERHTAASNFRVDTNFVFTNCGFIIP